MPVVDLDAGRIYYAARGPFKASAPIVFVHGAGGTHLVWNGLLAGLAETTRGFALDLPGHGRSGKRGCETIRDYAVVVLEFLQALELENAVLVGSSMGGAIAQTIALEFPERVLGLGLVATGARLRVLPAFLDGLRLDFANTAHQLNQYFFGINPEARLMQRNEALLLACGPEVLSGDFAACDAFDMVTRVPQIRAPTVILCGSEDRMTPLKYSQYLAEHIPGAELLVIEHAGHMVMLEKPDQVTRALIGLLERVERIGRNLHNP